MRAETSPGADPYALMGLPALYVERPVARGLARSFLWKDVSLQTLP